MTPEKSPENFGWITYAWVIGLSAMGGFVSFMRKVKDGHARAWNIVELIGEICTSAFAGVMTFYLCEYSNFDQLLTAAFVGIAGHMGSRSIMLFERLMESKFPQGSEKQ